MKTSEQIDKILPALAIVKTNLSGVKKGTKNTFFKSSYADLNAHLDVVETLLEENGLVLFQPVTNSDVGNVVSSRVYHTESGQYVESSMKLIGENDMQKAGSAVTYARRYTLGSLLSMRAVDDDANKAVGKVETKPIVASGGSATLSESGSIVTNPVTSKPSFRRPPKTTVAAVTTPSHAVVTTGDDL